MSKVKLKESEESGQETQTHTEVTDTQHEDLQLEVTFCADIVEV